MLLKIKGRDHSIKDTGPPETRISNAQLTHKGKKKKPHYLSVHLFYKLMNSGGAARQQRPRCPSPEVGRGAQLRGQQRGLGHFFHRGSQTPGPILSQRITNEDPGDKRQVRHIEPLHWGKSTCSIFAGGGGQQRRSRSGLAFHKRGSTKQA